MNMFQARRPNLNHIDLNTLYIIYKDIQIWINIDTDTQNIIKKIEINKDDSKIKIYFKF